MGLQNDLTKDILLAMSKNLIKEQLEDLEQVLVTRMHDYEITEPCREISLYEDKNYKKYLRIFLNTKNLEGCTQSTLKAYEYNIGKMLDFFNRNVEDIRSEDLKYYLSMYKIQRNVSNVTLDNIRRYATSFFTWLTNEGYLQQNPSASLTRIRMEKTIKKPLSEEEMELLRITCKDARERALIEFLYSTGVRVGELVLLDKDDVDFQNKTVIVYGKGQKERETYLNTKASIYLKMYLEQRIDNNSALFVGLVKPFNRLSISSIEKILRDLGNRTKIKCNPHKFRRTTATNALAKGMPVYEVSKLLGHAKLETTMIYSTVEQENVKINHKKYLNQ